jgi:hypothetical protein
MGSGGGWLAKSHGRLANFCVGLARGFLDTCLHKKGKTMVVEKVSGGQTHWPAGHVARPAGCHLVSYHLGQVSGAPPWPYKYPPTGESRHTQHFGDCTCKTPILSVVARRSLVGRVARL